MKLFQACLVSLALVAAACSGSNSDHNSTPVTGQGALTLLAADDPFASEFVTDATIWYDEIRVHRESPNAGFVTLYSGVPVAIDLLHLRNGVTQLLVTDDLPAGKYDQIRLVVSAAHLSLIDGDEFSTDLGNLHLTSTGHSGLKLFISPPLQVVDAVSRTLLLDVDLTKTFQAVPGNDPLNASFYMLKPVIHVADLSTTGEVRGTISEDDGAGGLIGVNSATVYLLPPGETDLTLADSTTATDSNGDYAMLGIDPGTYDIVAALGTRQVRVNGITVAQGSVTTVDAVLPP
jgi:hypothetical protein